MAINLYQEISTFAASPNPLLPDKSAMYIDASSFSKLALDSFRTTLVTILEKPGNDKISLTLRPFDVKVLSAIAGPSKAKDVATKFQMVDGEVFLVCTDTLDFKFALGVSDATGTFIDFTNFAISLKDLQFTISTSTNELIVRPGEATVIPSNLQRAPDFEDKVNASGLSIESVTRVEGMLFYGGFASSLKQTLSAEYRVDLISLFPGIRVDNSMKFAVSSDEQVLFISGTTSPNSQNCCHDIGDGIGEVKPGNGTRRTDPDFANDRPQIGEISIGGPTAVGDPLSSPGTGHAILGRRSLGQGKVGFYLPNSIAQTLAEGPYPAVRLDPGDNGFIGWKAAAIVDFNGFAFTPDFPNGRFYVDLNFRTEIYGSVHVDFGKLGKIRVTSFSAEQSGPGVNHVKIGFYFVIGTDGIFLKPVLEDVFIETPKVYLRLGTLVGSAFGGWGAVAGFVFDEILSKIIADQLPNKLDLELRKYMAKTMFPLLNAKYAATLQGLPGSALVALYDGGPEGFLVSVGTSW